jgi:hypothetical protein
MTSQIHRFAIGEQEHQTSVRFVLEVMKPEFIVEYIWHITDGHILRRNFLLQRVIEGKIKEGIEVTGRRGRKRRKLLDDLNERRGFSHLKEEALDRTMWTARFGRGLGPVVRQITK